MLLTSGIILCACQANERWSYIVTSSPVGLAHTQNDPCYRHMWYAYCRSTYIFVLVLINLCHNVVKVVACCWISDDYLNWTLRNKFQWNFIQNSNIFIEIKVLENVIWKMAAILFRFQCIIKFRENWSNHKENLHIQLCCLGMRKMSLWSDRCKRRYKQM